MSRIVLLSISILYFSLLIIFDIELEEFFLLWYLVGGIALFLSRYKKLTITYVLELSIYFPLSLFLINGVQYRLESDEVFDWFFQWRHIFPLFYFYIGNVLFGCVLLVFRWLLRQINLE